MIKVLVSYFLLIVGLSALILRPAVKGENIFKRFIIYIVFGNFYISTTVFILAYMNIFGRTSLIVTLTLMSPLIYIILSGKEFKNKLKSFLYTVKELILGTYGLKLFMKRAVGKIRTSIKGFLHELFAGRVTELLILTPIILYNVYQYSINGYRFSTYMAPDEEVHLYWVQSLIAGDIFPVGVYPHAFHNILGAISEVSGIKAMIILRCFGPTMIILIMGMLYIGLRKVFYSKYPALLGLMLYSVLDIYGEQVTHRFQFIIPQEYGMLMLVPLAIFLLDYIEDKKTLDLVLFGMSVSLVIGIHFYIGIIAAILVLSIGLVNIYKIFKDKIFFKILVCGILSVLVALAPLALGLALGHEMEQSMDWASDVIAGDIYSESKDEDQPLTLEGVREDIERDITKHSIVNINVFYGFIGIILLTTILNLSIIIFKKGDKKLLYQLTFALNSLFLIFLMFLRSLDLPTIMETKRAAIFFAYFSSIWLGMPLDIIIRFFSKIKIKKAIPYLSITTIAIALALVIQFDYLRPISRFYYFQPMGTMKVNKSIMENYKDKTWTAISPVNNISGILNSGYHYELDDFIIQQEDWKQNKLLQIPTEHVFIYIEKRPIINFGYGFYPEELDISNRETVSKKLAEKELSKNKEDNYHYVKERDILMSKAYYWAKEYNKYFPKEMSVYYEDEELIVYRIKQNNYALNNFSIDYGMNRRER